MNSWGPAARLLAVRRLFVVGNNVSHRGRLPAGH